MKSKKQTLILTLAFMALAFQSTITFAQQESNAESIFQRKGFLFEFGLGGGIISLEDDASLQNFDDVQGTFTFPELKFGYLLNDRLALTLSIPGMIYEINDYDRHFGAVLPSVQYWVKDRWWIHGGAGLAIDSPALYDIEDNVNDDWNTGVAVMISSGYEVYRKGNYALNIQSKLLIGGVTLDNDMDRNVVQFSVGVGFNWF